LEEFRDLSLEEWNFRVLVQENLRNLLEQKRIYGKQRGIIKWATLGDENTKFFHVNATIKHSRNAIRSLKDTNDLERSKHEEKATLLLESFKERLGTSEFTNMHFDLHDLLQPMGDLDGLMAPFSQEENDNIIMELKTNKSPGPDGFNTDFMKKCWHVINQDFYDL
jgi:hypothetical protein